MKRLAALVLGAALAGSPCLAASHFPALTGRVVDEAHVLSPATKHDLESQLANFETRTGDQLVVVTLPTLDGQTIEDYGYQLGRHWAIGQKSKDNGVLLIVAPKEHKVRIEVGYGLEGILTDALTRNIIDTMIVPAFKQGNMEAGIVQGAQGIMTVARGATIAMVTTKNATPTDDAHHVGIVAILIGLFLFSQIVLFALYLVGSVIAFILSLLGLTGLRDYLNRMKTRILPADRALLLWLLMPSSRITGSGGGSFSSGGFSGGGGSFGGGGSSGSW